MFPYDPHGCCRTQLAQPVHLGGHFFGDVMANMNKYQRAKAGTGKTKGGKKLTEGQRLMKEAYEKRTGQKLDLGGAKPAANTKPKSKPKPGQKKRTNTTQSALLKAFAKSQNKKQSNSTSGKDKQLTKGQQMLLDARNKTQSRLFGK